MCGSVGEIRKLLLGFPFDEQRNEISDLRLVEPMVNRPRDVVHGVRGNLWKSRQQPIDDLPDQTILFDADDHPYILANPVRSHNRDERMTARRPTASQHLGCGRLCQVGQPPGADNVARGPTTRPTV